MKTLIAFLRGLLPKFRPTIIKFVQAEMDKRQPEDINIIIKVLDKYRIGLDGETQEHLVNELHDACEQIIIGKISQL
jgi:hypothetical protein